MTEQKLSHGESLVSPTSWPCEARPGCAHHWVAQHKPGHLVYWVRVCSQCGNVDWDDLDEEISAAKEKEGKKERPVELAFDPTEVQMLYNAVQRVKPFAEMSEKMEEREAVLERRLREAVDHLARGGDTE